MRRLLSPIPLASICALIALVALLGYGLASTQADREAESGSGHGDQTEAPALELPRLSGGGETALADYRGRVVVLNIWASWCEPCRDEAPALRAAHERLRADRSGTVLGATYDDATADSKAFVAEQRLSYPSVRDVGKDLAEQYGTRSLPETFVLDREGRVVAVGRGEIDRAFLDAAIARAGGKA